MPKPSHREKLLHVGMRVVHERGFRGASVRDIVHAAGVPQGSFTNHFASKEIFGLEVIDLYRAKLRADIQATLRNDALPPLQRLRRYIDDGMRRLGQDGMKTGCLLGNFAAEACDDSEPIRTRLVEAFDELESAVADCLRAAAAAGEIVPDTDCDGMAAFVVASLQGAWLLSKARRSPQPAQRFEHVLFERLLKRNA